MSSFFGPLVHELTKGDFKEVDVPGNKVSLKFINKNFTKSKNGGLVVAYAPWCPHCHNLQPQITELAKVTKGLYPIGAIDSTNEKDGNDILVDFLNITGYPTIKLWNQGKFTDYTHGRSVKEMLQYLCLENQLCEFI